MKHEDQKKQRQEIYLVFLGGIFAVYLVYSFLFSPMLKKSKELSQTLTQKDNTTRTLYSQMAQYDIFAQNFKTALKNIEPQKNKFVSNPTSYEYVNYIKNIVFLNGLNILSINGSEQTDFQANTKDYEATDPYTVYDEGDKNLPVIMLQSVKLEVVGSYEGIKKMVNTLNQEKRVIINNAEYNRVFNENPALASARLNINFINLSKMVCLFSDEIPKISTARDIPKDFVDSSYLGLLWGLNN